MVQKYSIFAAIQRNDVMRNAYLINLVRVLCGLPVSGDSTEPVKVFDPRRSCDYRVYGSEYHENRLTIKLCLHLVSLQVSSITITVQYS